MKKLISDPRLVKVTTKLPSKAWKRKYECKKNKGKHTFEPQTIINWFEYTVETTHGTAHGSYKPRHGVPPMPLHQMGIRSQVQWECTGCKKQIREYLHTDPSQALFSWSSKKLDKYR